MQSNEQKIDPIIWAVVFLAVVVAIATIAVTADAKRERYLIDSPITNGGKHDKETKGRLVFPDNDYTADHRTNDRIFQNRNLSAAPAGSAKSSAGSEKHGVGANDATGAVNTQKTEKSGN